MSCNSIGADVMDSTSKDILTDQTIDMTDTWFEMSPKQKKIHERTSSIYTKIRNEYHALHSSLWFSFDAYPNSIGERLANYFTFYYNEHLIPLNLKQY